MRIVLAGEDAAGIQTLRMLDRRRSDVVAVMAEPPAGGAGASVWSAAHAAGMPTWPAARLTDPAFADVLREHAVDVLLNVYSLYVVDAAVLAAPTAGCFNLHPGPLPAYAGLNSVSWAIHNGERSHGVTLHRMEPEVDSGAIAYQTVFTIDESDTGLIVSSRCVTEGLLLVRRLLETLERGAAAVPRVEQDLRRRSYFGAASPVAGVLDWAQPAAAVVNHVRACDYHPLASPWGTPRVMLAGREVGIVKAHRLHDRATEPAGTVRTTDGPSIQVACADEWISVDLVRVDDRRRAPADVLPVEGTVDGGGR